MPVNEKYLARFEFEKTYHIYNKTNNKELLFRSDENYCYFLRQYSGYISLIADTYAWNLLPNHFHFIIKIKSALEISTAIQTLPHATRSERLFLENNDIDILAEMTFKRLFTSYAMAFNKMYQRSGNLFYRTFKRVSISKDNHFTQAIVYVHANAEKHRLVKDFTLYPWTSYHSIVSNRPTKLLKDEIIAWFGGRQQFIEAHKELTAYYLNFPGKIEDEDL